MLKFKFGTKVVEKPVWGRTMDLLMIETIQAHL